MHLDWLDLAAFLAIGGVWFAIFCGTLKGHPLEPRNDPRLSLEVVTHAA
jgi:hypothetical protein